MNAPHKLKVLIVDDDAIVLEVTRELLEGHGHEVHVRERALGTTPWILAERPDVVLIDVEMPGIAGDQILQVSRERASDTATAFVLYSALPAHELASLARRSGAAGYVSKGVGDNQLIEELNQLVCKHLAATAPS
ncbi:MAG: response regulator [Myxococcales bacterium]|nr:response regulator [Myxococcales bacterium]